MSRVRSSTVRAGLAAVVVVAGVLGAGCGVEVPDDVDAPTSSTAAPTTEAAATTQPPTSDDDLEQALIGYGYSEEEAACGAENLRAALEPDEISDLVQADSIADISPSVALDFADALRPCVEGGSGGEPAEPSSPEDPSDPVPTTTPGGSDPMPELPDEGDGEVTPTRFFAALVAAGYAVDEARCVVDAFYDTFDQATIEEIFRSDGPEDVDPEVAAAVQDILDSCR